MSDIWISSTERAPLSEEAREIAVAVLLDVHSEFDNDVPTHGIPGLTAPERMLKKLRNTDRNYQSECSGDESVFFGITRQPYPYIYDAIVKGYNPSAAQLEARRLENGNDFL